MIFCLNINLIVPATKGVFDNPAAGLRIRS